MCIKKLIPTTILSILPFWVMAQLGTWNILNAKLELNDKWNVFGEAQIRSLKYYDNFHYYELKGGATYRFSKTASLSAGIGMFDTYAAGGTFKTPMANDETRTWLQLALTQTEKKLKFEHRYRAEQRWTSNGYRNRFRYRLNTVLPINKKKVDPKTFYLNASNEIFFTNKATYFERNRFFLGGGYAFSDLFTIQSGWLQQFDYRINDETGRSFFQNLFCLIYRQRRKRQNRYPEALIKPLLSYFMLGNLTLIKQLYLQLHAPTITTTPHLHQPRRKRTSQPLQA